MSNRQGWQSVTKHIIVLFMLCSSFVIKAQSTVKTEEKTIKQSIIDTVERARDKHKTTESILDQRRDKGKEGLNNPFSISQYRQNYLLPFSYVTNPNPLTVDGLTSENVDNFEAKYQVSVTMPLYLHDADASGVYFGFTLNSFWQLYNSDASKPFRETNYEPEVFYQWDANWDLFGYRFNLANIGINHHSNGQNGLKSRSWNRLYASVIFSDADSLYYLKTWYRLPEEDKLSPTDPAGDDNPDILDYYGRAEIGYAFTVGKVNVMSILRNNLKFNDNRGSIELNMTYPINQRYDWLVQYFNGYGDSLIDYNRHQERISLGVQLRFL